MKPEELYNRYKDTVYRVCMRYTANEEDALDVMQEVFIKVFKSLNSFKKNSELLTWIYRIATNACIDYVRKQKSLRLDHSDSYIDTLACRNRNMEHIDSVMTVDVLLQKLKPKDREVVFLYYIEGLTHDEVAEVMGVSRSAVHKRLKTLDLTKLNRLELFFLIFFAKINFLVAFQGIHSSNL